MKYSHLFCAFIISLPVHAEEITVSHLEEQAYEHVKKEEFDLAIACWRTIISHNPDDINAHFQLAYSCMASGNLADALNEYRFVSSNCPGARLSAFHNSAYVLKLLGEFDAAINIFKTLVDAQPDYESAHLGLSFAYIMKGDFKKGWEAHYWNLVHQGKHAPEFHEFLKNDTLTGKRILLKPEGGFGDTINFIRYAKRIKERGAIVIASVQGPLLKILGRCKYIDEMVPHYVAAQATYDGNVTYMSLPPLFCEDEEHLLAEVPYVFPDPQLVLLWRNKTKNDTRFKIGICWQADVHNDSSRLPFARRGIPLKEFEQLIAIPGISLYSLQKKEGLEQLESINNALPLTIFADSFDEQHGSFMDTAALMHSMDLIITIDSAVAHLAGAMGRPVWLLLPFSADWRWTYGRTTSPWYPTMRIFKQPRPFDWTSVMTEVHDALKEKLIH